MLSPLQLRQHSFQEVAIKVANRIVINDVKVFMAACCQSSVADDKS